MTECMVWTASMKGSPRVRDGPELVRRMGVFIFFFLTWNWMGFAFFRGLGTLLVPISNLGLVACGWVGCFFFFFFCSSSAAFAQIIC
jgi:hypothetical protein